MPPTVLFTGFEPFDQQAVNPSALAVQRLAGRPIVGHRVVAEVLPVAFDVALHELRRAIRRHQPAVVICVGQAGGRPEISIERVAINVDDARIPDNLGAQPIDRPIVPRGPAAYWSTLPIKAIVAALQARELPAAVSQSAGTYVCNHVFYGLMHALARRPGVRGGFVHVPFLPEQATDGAPSLPLDQMVAGLALCAEIALTVRTDLREVGGTTH